MFPRRNALHCKLFHKKDATCQMASSLLRRYMNFWGSGRWRKLFDFFLIVGKSSLRRHAKVLQCIRKGNSVAMAFGREGQNLLAFSTLKCLPFSILKLWFESLNLVSVILSCVFILECAAKYPSTYCCFDYTVCP